MNKSLQKAIDVERQFHEDIKSYSSDKLFAMRDAAARCVCDFLKDNELSLSKSLLAQYVIFNEEILRRMYEE